MKKFLIILLVAIIAVVTFAFFNIENIVKKDSTIRPNIDTNNNSSLNSTLAKAFTIVSGNVT